MKFPFYKAFIKLSSEFVSFAYAFNFVDFFRFKQNSAINPISYLTTLINIIPIKSRQRIRKCLSN